MTTFDLFRKVEASNDPYARPHEFKLPISIYDIEIGSADGKSKDILAESRGKVTLLFNVAAGCGNIPQHSVLEELNQRYRREKNFNIVAVVVDDFQCHGYEEFQDGLDKYIEKNNLSITPGQLSEAYARDNFGVTYKFSELVNGRHDKHVYSGDYCPGGKKTQEQHLLWSYLTQAYKADLLINGIPASGEEVPWSDLKIKPGPEVETFFPLTANFTKFLVDKTGTKVKRYANGFLLGERNAIGQTFPWFPEKYQIDGRRDHRPINEKINDEEENGPWPTSLQRRGIEMSLEIISQDIDEYLQTNL